MTSPSTASVLVRASVAAGAAVVVAADESSSTPHAAVVIPSVFASAVGTSRLTLVALVGRVVFLGFLVLPAFRRV